MIVVRTSGTCCRDRVHIAQVDTITRRIRLARAERKGLEPDLCWRPATFLVDGEPRCAAHAGRNALTFLLGEKT